MAHRLKLAEKDVARQIDDMLRLNGAQVWPIKEPFCPHCRRFTGSPAQRGMPDRFVLVMGKSGCLGVPLWLELKRPGGRVRTAQADFIDIAYPSMHCLIADSWEAVRDYIEKEMCIELKVRG